MTTNISFDDRLAAWLEEDATQRVPDHLDEVLVQTRWMRQRAWWSSPERWLPLDTTFSGRIAPTFRPAWALVLVGALLIALVAALLLAGSRPRLPAPFGPAANGVIVYSANGDIMAVDANASNARALVGGDEADVAVSMAPDGTRFAFVRRNAEGLSELLIANIDGTDVESLPTAPLRNLMSADWSPDGKMLIAIHDTPGRGTLSILPTDGSGSRRDLDLGRVSIEVPGTSSIGWLPPDGRELAFRGFEPGGVAVYAIRPDGTGLRRIAPLEANGASYLGLRLSPDGTRGTFWHNRPGDTSDGSKAEVHVLDFATGRDVRIAFDPRSHHEYLPRFSPDGRSILLAQVTGVTDETRLLIAAANGNGARQVGPVQPFGDNPMFDFSPDGAKVVLSFLDVTAGMQVIDVDTGVVLPGPEADYPSWQRTAQ